jgi:hypothetical protein
LDFLLLFFAFAIESLPLIALNSAWWLVTTANREFQCVEDANVRPGLQGVF